MTTKIWMLLLFLFSSQVHGAELAFPFDTNQQEQRYHSLIDELRCLVCQNQNLADSNAGLAADLRQRTYEMIRRGDSDEAIINYMVERYGDFVLYRPPLKTTTLLLWFGPAIILVISMIAVWRYTVRNSRNSQTQLSDAQRQQVRDLLNK